MNPKLYRVHVQLKDAVRKIELVAIDTNFSQSRLERELFGKASVKPYKIIKHEVIKGKLGI